MLLLIEALYKNYGPNWHVFSLNRGLMAPRQYTCVCTNTDWGTARPVVPVVDWGWRYIEQSSMSLARDYTELYRCQSTLRGRLAALSFFFFLLWSLAKKLILHVYENDEGEHIQENRSLNQEEGERSFIHVHVQLSTYAHLFSLLQRSRLGRRAV